jgi:hypothetical protein
MRWELPPGAAPSKLPDPVEIAGPLGLAFKMGFAAEPPAGGATSQAITTTVVMNVPSLAPASSYSEVRTFYEAVQKASEMRVVANLKGGAP